MPPQLIVPTRRPPLFIRVYKTLKGLTKTEGSTIQRIAAEIYFNLVLLGLKPNPKVILMKIKRALDFGVRNNVVAQKGDQFFLCKGISKSQIFLEKSSLKSFDSLLFRKKTGLNKRSWNKTRNNKKKKTKKKVTFKKNNYRKKKTTRRIVKRKLKNINLLGKKKKMILPKYDKASKSTTSGVIFKKDRDKITKPWIQHKPPTIKSDREGSPNSQDLPLFINRRRTQIEQELRNFEKYPKKRRYKFDENNYKRDELETEPDIKNSRNLFFHLLSSKSFEYELPSNSETSRRKILEYDMQYFI